MRLTTTPIIGDIYTGSLGLPPKLAEFFLRSNVAPHALGDGADELLKRNVFGRQFVPICLASAVLSAVDFEQRHLLQSSQRPGDRGVTPNAGNPRDCAVGQSRFASRGISQLDQG